MTDPPRSIRCDALLVSSLHVVVALYYWLGRGVTIVHDYGPDAWSWFWQNVPRDLLEERALESLWYLHAQPPLWNGLGAALIKLFGDGHMHVLQGLNVLAGAATTALCFSLATRLTGSRRWGLGCGLVVALHPALFLFEAYGLYTSLVAFAVVLAADLIARTRTSGSPAPALAFVGVIAALVLTRSLFHLLLLAGAVPFALALTGRPTRAQAAVLALLVAVPVGWYGKNAAQYGFFGASSWYGMGLWRSALFAQDADRLEDLLERGLLEPVVTLPPFSAPSGYAQLGFQARSEVPLLSRDNLHNVNVPAISRSYYRSSRALILRTPLRYARNVVTGYGNFCAPSSAFAHLEPNRQRIELHARVASWLLLRPAVAGLERHLRLGYIGTVYFLLIPLAVVVPLTRLAGVRDRHELVNRLRADAAPLYLAGIVAYTAAVGSALELGENTRFKFMVEPAILLLVTVAAHRAIARWRTTSASGEEASRGSRKEP